MAADPKALQQHAVEAERHLEALATGLGQLGAPENVVSTVTKMADVTRKVATTLSDARGEGPPEHAEGDLPPGPPTPQGGPPPEQTGPPPADSGPRPRDTDLRGPANDLREEVAGKARGRRAAGTY